MVFDKWFMARHSIVARAYEVAGMKEVSEIATTIGIEDLYLTEMTEWSAEQEYARERLELIYVRRHELMRAFQAMILPGDGDGDEEDNDPELDAAFLNSQRNAHKEYKTKPEELLLQFLDGSKCVPTEKTACLGCFDELLEGNAFKVPCRNQKCQPFFCENCFRDFLCTTRTTEHYNCPLCKGTFALDAHSEHPAHPAHPEDEEPEDKEPDSGLASAANS
jgi:hypothetical protein